MRSATDFLPWLMSTLTNFATSPFEYLGSGRISRLGISLRRGMMSFLDALCGLGFLGAVFGAALLAVLDSGGVERAAHHVVAHAWKVLHAAAANQDDRVFLQVVALASDVADDFEAVGETYLGDLAQSRVRLLGRRGIDARAHPAFLR